MITSADCLSLAKAKQLMTHCHTATYFNVTFHPVAGGTCSKAPMPEQSFALCHKVVNAMDTAHALLVLSTDAAMLLMLTAAFVSTATPVDL